MTTSGRIKALSLREAIDMQFKFVDCIHRHFPDGSFLETGDLGLGIQGRPEKTVTAEKVLADFFGAEACALVRGAGTGAIRMGLETIIKPGQSILLHAAPIYPSTKDSIEAMGLKPVFADFNNPDELKSAVAEHCPAAALVQHARQLLTDSYDLTEVISCIHSSCPKCRVIVDDNYAIFKDPTDGIAAGADLTAFSVFKLQGPQGVGCVLGKAELVDIIHKRTCTGGTQVQGFEAMDIMRSLVAAPVLLAIQAEETDKIHAEIEKLIKAGGSGICDVFTANMQSRVIMVEFEKPIARQVIAHAVKLGASPRPVGAESRYEVPALFYKASRTFLASNAKGLDYFIRINPMRAGCDTVMRILTEAIKRATQEDEKCLSKPRSTETEN